jgi:TolA-binding protein
MPGVFPAQAATPQNSAACCSGMEEVKAKYLAENKYNELIDFLNSSKDKDKVAQLCRDYSKAQVRYLQLKYLEDKQSWDDYFANGNTYRDQLVENAQQVAAQADSASYLKVKSRLLLWQFHRDQQDAFAQPALEDLIADTQVYAKGPGETDLIKEVADALSASAEKSKARQIYKLYVDGLLSQKMSAEQLKNTAAGFYKQDNLDLAQGIYDIYIDEISKTVSVEKLVSELFEIASLFVYKPTGLYDMPYAEKIYSRIEATGQKDAFNQDAIYLRAFNLEKMKAYKDAQKFYLKLIQTYSDNKYLDEANYKVGMIYAYSLGDIDSARKYFDILGSKTKFNQYVTSALYQLGLLSQWQGDMTKADGYYALLLNNAQEQYVLTVARARERLKEIQDNKPLEYNLKTFLDLSLKNEPALMETDKAELKSASYLLSKNQNNTVSSSVNMPQSGCSQVELQYLWSGDLGGASPTAAESSLQSVYSDSGTKEINLVVVSAAGIIDRAFIMVDVY